MWQATKDFFGAFGGWVFLGAVAAAYVLVGISDADVALDAVSRFGFLLGQVLPAIVLVFGLMFVLSLFLERRWLVRHLGRGAGLPGWALTVFCGVLSAGPIYVWYPLLRELREKGVRNALTAAFLYSRALKLPLLPLMVHYFGFAYTVTLSACIVVFSVASGLLTERLAGTGLSRTRRIIGNEDRDCCNDPQ